MFNRCFAMHAVAFALTSTATNALAHAQLQQAVPAVGGSARGSPSQLTLRFSEGIEPRFSSVSVTSEDGSLVSVGAVSVQPPGGSVVTVKLRKVLRPGTYVVDWRATSVDSHKTQGSYRFTVEP